MSLNKKQRWTMWRSVAVVAGSSLIAAILHAPPAVGGPYKPGSPQKEPVVAGKVIKPVGAVAAEPTGSPYSAAAPVWPGRASVAVGADTLASARVSAESATQLRVQTFDRAQSRAAGVDGVLMRVSRADGAAASASGRITVDYNGFRHAYGGGWAARLRLFEVPQCAMSTPQAPGCQAKALASVNNTKAGTVSADVVATGMSVSTTDGARGAFAGEGLSQTVTSGGTFMALAAEPSGPGGDYQATTLSPSATWSAGGNSGDFSWNYALRTPPSAGGPAPSIALAYSSSGVDGKMAASNSQPSFFGEGFDWQPGFVERRYNSCADDMGNGANNTTKTGDQCWDTDNAMISLPGHAGELIHAGADKWRLRADDGTIVERKTGASNGDNNGEWWLATTSDGTQYWFGGRWDSQATLVANVFGNHSGEQCHMSTFAASHCHQGYRWQLDHVVDVHGNTMNLTYAKETNKYGRNNTPANDTIYDRAGYVTKIEYGTRTGSSGNAPMQVLFEYGNRCLTDCHIKDAAHYPDVPFDQECSADTCGLTQLSQSYWTTKRVIEIKTQVWGGTSYRDVEKWTFGHSFPDPMDSLASAALWLDKISHVGLVGETKTIPDITFTGVRMPNRVDTLGDQYPAMNRYRLKTITAETGGKTSISYSTPDCDTNSGRLPDKNNLHLNVLRCYPVKWTPAGKTKPIDDFFHKYLVTDVVETDVFGSSTRAITHYDYDGDPAWHYTDEDGMTKKEMKTWSVWRGYGTVKTTKGDPGEQTREERRYFRGMHGDKLPSGHRTVTLPAIAIGNVPAVNDEDGFAGQVRETILYNGPGGAEVSATVSRPWQSDPPTASRTLEGTTVHARHIATEFSHTRTTLDGGRPTRTTSAKTFFDTYGMPVKVEDYGDDAVTDDEKCSLTDYVRNTSLNILGSVSRVRSYAVDCTKAAGTLTEADVLSDTKTSFDGQPWNQPPTRGLATKTETMVAFAGGVPTHAEKSSSTYDTHGRVKDTYDVRGVKVTMGYTPETGGPVTATSERQYATSSTGTIDWTKTTTMEPAWGVPLTSTDVNGRKVEFLYDGLGRLAQVWLPGRARTETASIIYDYVIRNNAYTVLTTKRLNSAGGYITSHKFHDSLLRLRQTQDPDHATGSTKTIVADSFYDSAGREFKTHDPYVAPVSPGVDVFVPTANIPSIRERLYDGAGREMASVHKVNAPPASPGGTEVSRTTSIFGGDRLDTIPPDGGTVTSAFTNAAGKTVERREYHLGVPLGSPTGFNKTSFKYDKKDHLIEVTDNAGNKWTYKYDVQGRQTESVDPDKGTVTTKFNAYGDIEWTNDGSNKKISYKYDAIGRKISLHDGEFGALRAEWYYDRLANGTDVRGQLTKSTRYVGTAKYIKEHTGYTIDYKPNATKYTIPFTETGLNGSYTYLYGYHQDGSSSTTELPGMGDLPAEQLTHGYNALGKATYLDTNIGFTSYVEEPNAETPATEYTSFGELAAIHLRHNAGDRVDQIRTYEDGTRRLAQIWTTRQTAPTGVADLRLTYDDMGNVIKLSDLTANDHQCFTVDHLRQMENAWTPQDGNCATPAASAVLGGPAPYRHLYEYDTVGNRKKLTEYGTSTGTKTTTYTMAPGTHRLASTRVEDNTGTRDATYTYHGNGGMWTRPTPSSGTQTMQWDAEGHLASSADSTGTTTYIYDADGNRLIRKDPSGKTLYLPGQEMRYQGGVKTCTRYYSHAGQTIAMRTAAQGVTWLVGDHHGTARAAIKAVGQAVAQTLESPFGALRHTSGTWPSGNTKGFVGGTNDNTGLVHLGAREYDSLTGRFTSVDPVMDVNDPQQMNGYNYANNGPITASDPDGLWPKFISNVASAVTKTVTAVTAPVVSAAKAVGTFVYDNAGTISTVLGVAAMVCTVIPPLQAAAPFLGAAATVVGAIETAKTCSQGMSFDCAMGITDLIPGGRALSTAAKGAKYADEAADAAQTAGKNTPAPKTPDACTHSFTPNTKVLMADGGRKEIGAVKVGDEVLATDPIAGVTEAKPVTALHLNRDKDLTDLTVSVDPDPATPGDETTETINTTWTHPFWDLNSRDWVDASELEPGDRLSGLGGAVVTVVQVHNRLGDQHMNDLTVAHTHTYYVFAADTPVLVHNCDAIAIGLNRVEGHDMPLEDFADRTGALMHSDWPLAKGQSWESFFLQALSPESKTKIHVSLLGIDNPKAWAKDQAGKALPDAGRYTAWELAMIKAAPASVRKRVTWYDQNGERMERGPFDRRTRE